MNRWFLGAIAALLLVAALLIPALFGEEGEVIRLSGETMGTRYNVTIVKTGLDPDMLAAVVQEKLKLVNASMSSWDPNSEVSRFTALQQTGPMKISRELVAVMAAAEQVHRQSKGRFDVTLGPLIELWGFGPQKPADLVPSNELIAAAMQHVGQGRLLHLDSVFGTLAKSDGQVGVNLSAIAKGYGIDAVAAALRKAGIDNYMVEIGGDLVTRGTNQYGEHWRIGVEQPRRGAKTVQLVLPLTNLGLATSGDYRNFFEVAGVRYSHILDATTGRPVSHRTNSVTVVAPNAMLADAWATAMLALGEQAGLKIANRHGLAVFFISRDASGPEGTYITEQSDAFANLLTVE